MIEVTFSQSAASCLQAARERGLGDEDLAETVYCLPLELDIGPLQPDVLGPERKATLDKLHAPLAFGTELADQALETAATALREIPVLLKNEEHLRIWGSDAPFEACGLVWFLSWLSQLPARGGIELVHLPAWLERPDGQLVMHTSCEELTPEDFAQLAHSATQAPALLLAGMDFEWKQLVAQNAPLRTALCGRVLSVPEDFYDFLLYQQITAMDDVFSEALLIGNALGYSQIGLSDGWLASRIEHMIKKGELGIVDASSDEGAPAYHRTLRKLTVR